VGWKGHLLRLLVWGSDYLGRLWIRFSLPEHALSGNLFCTGGILWTFGQLGTMVPYISRVCSEFGPRSSASVF